MQHSKYPPSLGLAASIQNLNTLITLFKDNIHSVCVRIYIYIYEYIYEH